MDLSHPQHGGYDFPVDPEINAPNAAVFWVPKIAPAAVGYVLPVPGNEVEAPRIEADALSVMGTQDGLMYVRLKTGALLVLDPKALKRPAGILVPLDQHWDARFNMIKKLRTQLLNHKQSPPHLTSQQRRRISLALRAFDARRERASYQMIAMHFFGINAVKREYWKTSSLKAQVARLSAQGTQLTSTGYRFLLLGQGLTGRTKPQKSSA